MADLIGWLNALSIAEFLLLAFFVYLLVSK